MIHYRTLFEELVGETETAHVSVKRLARPLRKIVRLGFGGIMSDHKLPMRVEIEQRAYELYIAFGKEHGTCIGDLARRRETVNAAIRASRSGNFTLSRPSAAN